MKLPEHLDQEKATGIHPGESVAQFEIGSYQNFVYLILDWTTQKAAIVDPQQDVTALLASLARYSFELISIFLTHTHSDHTAGLPELLKKFPKIPIVVHKKELHRLSPETIQTGKIHDAQDGEYIAIGNLRIQVLHTPGHSSGECCYLLEGATPHIYLFSGDTLFIRDCGRTDMESGNTEQMFHSLQKIRNLTQETIILPGHHYKNSCASTLDRELHESPPFQCSTALELDALP